MFIEGFFYGSPPYFPDSPWVKLSSQSLFFRLFHALHHGMRIAITGPNGSGKSTLLKMLLGTYNPSEGSIGIPKGVSFGYVPQVIEAFPELSGGQRRMPH